MREQSEPDTERPRPRPLASEETPFRIIIEKGGRKGQDELTPGLSAAGAKVTLLSKTLLRLRAVGFQQSQRRQQARHA